MSPHLGTITRCQELAQLVLSTYSKLRLLHSWLELTYLLLGLVIRFVLVPSSTLLIFVSTQQLLAVRGTLASFLLSLDWPGRHQSLNSAGLA